MDGLYDTWVIVFVIAYVVTAIWMFNDVFDQHGPEGCVIVGLIYLLLAPLFPLILLVYIVLRAISYGGPARPPKSEDQLTQYNWRTSSGGASADGSRYTPPSGPITANESDEELDLLLAERRFRQAYEQAVDKLKLAQSFGDPAGVRKYRKYADFAQLRAAKR